MTTLTQLYQKHPDKTRVSLRKQYYRRPENDVFRKPRALKRNEYLKILPVTNVFGSTLQVDLMITDKFARRNKGMNYFFVCICVYSRYLWVIPIKTKSGKNVLSAFRTVFEDIPDENLNTITMDMGKEFKNSEVYPLLKSKGLTIYIKDPKSFSHTTAIVERANRSVWEFLRKWMWKTQDIKYLQSLPRFVTLYNNTIHSTIKAKPNDVRLKKAIPLHIVRNIRMKFKVGDNVRLILKLPLFAKRSLNRDYRLTFTR